MSSPQASRVVGSDDDEPAQVTVPWARPSHGHGGPGPGDWSGGPRGVVVRCVGNGLLSTQKSPNFIFSFTILVIPG